MLESDLVEIFGVGGKNDDEVKLQYNKRTKELYVNNKKVVTEVSLTVIQKILVFCVSISIITQGVMSVFSYFKM